MEREMPDHSVVVKLNQYERSRRNQPAAETLAALHGCRDLLIEGVSRVLTRQAEAMENTLLAMADRSPLLETRNVYYGAQGILNKQANALLAACRDAYLASFDVASFRGGNRKSDKSLGNDSAELSLVGDQDFELTLAIDKATSRLRYNCAEELVALDARVAHLLERSDLPENDNPLGPRILCEALLKGIADQQLAQNVQVVLLNQFDLVLTTELARIYQSINRYLIDHGILPDIKVGMKARGSASHAATASPQPDATGNDILALFEQMTQGAGASGGAPGARLPFGGSGSGSGTASTGFNLLESLGRLQSGALMLPGGSSFSLPSLDAGIDAHTVQNILRNLQQSPVMQSASPLDAMMVDAVAMLFDVVFDEDAIPDRLKAQIARLQIPVLKAAMQDRGFFSQRNHPVRRMLDAIAILSVHLPDTEAGNARLLEISHIVTQVLENFDQDLAVFQTAAEALESLDAVLEENVDAGLQHDIAEIKQAERAELAPVVVHDFINRALKDQAVAEPVVDFLRREWARLLTADYIRDGESDPHFNSHLETMRELVWSVQSKADMDARLMLVRILPGLLKRLREGVAEIALSQPVSDHFFATLVILHANAVRPNAQPVPLPEILLLPESTLATEQPDDIAIAPPDTACEIAPDPIVTPEIEDLYTLRARELGKGDWVEFHYEDGTFRWARLGWVSGVRSTYLFSDQDGLNSFSISLYRLADKLRSGEAVIVERKSITESAFSKLLNLFRQKLSPAY